jgi:hypothetical protein
MSQATLNLETPRAIDWLPGALLLIVTVAMAGGLVLQPDADRPALAWFSPLLSADQAVQAAASAGARIIGHGRLPTSLVVQPDETDGLARLRAAGAWLVVNARIAGGCGLRLEPGE